MSVDNENISIIICNFSDKEAKQISTCCRFIGVKGVVLPKITIGNISIEDITKGNYEGGNAVLYNPKCIMFNNVSNEKIDKFKEGLKRLKIKNTILTSLTEEVQDMSVNELLIRLLSEKKDRK